MVVGIIKPADIVLGDNHGRSASKALVNEIEDFFISEGLSVKINDPYQEDIPPAIMENQKRRSGYSNRDQ